MVPIKPTGVKQKLIKFVSTLLCKVTLVFTNYILFTSKEQTIAKWAGLFKCMPLTLFEEQYISPTCDSYFILFNRDPQAWHGHTIINLQK